MLPIIIFTLFPILSPNNKDSVSKINMLNTIKIVYIHDIFIRN